LQTVDSSLWSKAFSPAFSRLENRGVPIANGLRVEPGDGLLFVALEVQVKIQKL
jgi:hypothetical protein